MNKLFTITYECLGGRNTDYINVYANSFTNAIKEFCNHEFEIAGVKVMFTEYAIIDIKIEG
jgi:hypothetical protein